MHALTQFLTEHNAEIERFQGDVDIQDLRDVGGDEWVVSLQLDAVPSEDDDGEDITRLNLCLWEDDDGQINGRYTLDFEINGIGLNDRSALAFEPGLTQADIGEWYLDNCRVFDLTDVVEPFALAFIEQSESLRLAVLAKCKS